MPRPRTPNLNALRMFDAAARHLNFRLAAEEMNLTQGAVAQQVRRLEADLGVRLFERKARGLALTAVGRRYRDPVARALAIVDEATAELRPAPARVTISVPPSVAAKWLVPRLGRFAQARPEIDLQTVASEGLADFRSDLVDVAIRQGRPPFGDGLEAVPLADLDLVAVSAPGAPEARRIADFADRALIEDGHRHWTALFEEAGLAPPSRALRFNQTALAIDAAANGQGVALAPRLLVQDALARGDLAELWRDRAPGRGGFQIVRPAGRPPSDEVRAVIDWVLSEAKATG